MALSTVRATLLSLSCALALAACGGGADQQSPRAPVNNNQGSGSGGGGGGGGDSGPNTAPTAVGSIGPQTATNGVNFTLNTSGNFSDADGDTLTYSLAGLPAGTGLSIDPNTGVISGAPNNIDENASPLTVNVIATDSGGASVTQSFVLTVNAAGTPVLGLPFDDQEASLNSNYGLDAAEHFADPDGQPLTYSATGLPPGVTIDPNTGVVSGAPTATGTFPNVVITATDPDNNSVSGQFSFTVNPAGDPEPLKPIEDQVGTLNAPFGLDLSDHFGDPDGEPLTYSASGLPAGLTIDAETGVISGSPAVTGDFGPIVVTATDPSGDSTSNDFNLTVGPAGSPLVSNPIGPQTGSVGAPLTIATGDAFTDPDGQDLSFSAADLPAGVSIDPNTGTISGTPTEAGPFSVTVTAQDPDGNTVSETFLLNVNPNGTPLNTRDIDDQQTTVNEPFGLDISSNFSEPDGQALLFTAVNLPAGLLLDQDTGVISGRPTEVDSFQVVITATDPDGNKVNADFILDVAPNGTPVLTTGIEDQGGAVNEPFSFVTGDHFVDPENQALLFAANGLPPGLAIDPNTGEISGNPTTVGSFPVELTVTDPDGNDIVETFTIDIGPSNQPFVADPIDDQTSTLGAPFSLPTNDNFSDPNGDDLSFSASGLPAGVTIDPNTGLISGNPSELGEFAVTVTAMDPDGNTVSDTFSLAVNPDGTPVLNQPLEDATGTVGQNLGIDTADSFFDPDGQPLLFSAANLPAGVMIDPDTGVISGAPTEDGFFPVIVTATDPDGNSVSGDFGLQVAPAGTPTTTGEIGDQFGTNGVPLSLPLGGEFFDPDGQALTFDATNLPPGLSINPNTGEISGTPTAEGDFPVTMTATDPDGNSVTVDFVIRIGPNGSPTLNQALDDQNGTVGLAFATDISGNFSDPEGDNLTFSAVGLPPGISISSAGIIGGTPTAAGGFAVVVTATDTSGNTVTDEFEFIVAPAGTPSVSPPLVDQSTTAGTPFSYDTGASFTDPDGQALTFTAANLPAGLSIDPNTGVISGTASETGQFPVVVTATDPDGNEVSDRFFLTVNPATGGTPPVAVTDLFLTNQNLARTLPVLDNDADPSAADNSALSVNSFDAMSANGGTINNNSGVLTYTPPNGFVGNDSFDYTVTNGSATSAAVTVNIVVLEGRIQYRSDIDSVVDTATPDASQQLYLANPRDPDNPTLINQQVAAGDGVRPAQPGGYATNPFTGPGTLPDRTFYVADLNDDDIFNVFTAQLDVADPSTTQTEISQATAAGDNFYDLKPLTNGTTVLYRGEIGADFDGRHLYLVDINDPGNATQLTPNSYNRPPVLLLGNINDAVVEDDYQLVDTDSAVIYRADGNTAGTTELFMVNFNDPGNPIQLNVPLLAGTIAAFNVSADGRWVAYASNQDNPGTNELFLIDRNAPLPNTVKVSGVTNPLSIGVATNTNAIKFSPDSNSVFYLANQDSLTATDLYRIDLSGGAPAGPGSAVLMGPARAALTSVKNDYQISSDNSQVFYRSGSASPLNPNDPLPLIPNDLFVVDVATPVVQTQLSPTVATALNGVTAFRIGRDPNLVNPDRLVFRADHRVPLTNELFLIRDASNPGAPEQINTPLPLPIQGVVDDFVVTFSGNRVIFNADFRTATVFELFVVDFSFIDTQFRISETMSLTGGSPPSLNDPNAAFDGTDVEDFVVFP